MKRNACPICGQDMGDFYAVTYKIHPFIDGSTYPQMCFGCAHVPVEYTQTYSSDGSIAEERGPFFTHEKLKTAQELFEAGSTSTLAEAQRCIRGVRKRLKQVGKVKLKKLKLKRPEQEYEQFDNQGEPKPRKGGRIKKAPAKKRASK